MAASHAMRHLADMGKFIVGIIVGIIVVVFLLVQCMQVVF
jgi:hypothetical protein